MSVEQSPTVRLLAPLKEGRVEPGSERGRALIQDALKLSPEETVAIVKPIDPAALREGMRTAAFSEDRIEELVRVPSLGQIATKDPFRPVPVIDTPSPFPDPAEEMRRGPRPR
jgi:hypothetical protein